MIYILRHPKTNKEVRTDSWKRMIRWKARGYVIVNQYDPKKIQNCKA
jgi:hypothetical protein